MADNMLRVMDYAYVVNDKKMKGSGLNRGDMLMITSTKPAPVKKSDPYLQRVYVLCVKVVDGEHQIPGEKNDYMQYLVDPRNLEPVEEEVTKKMHEILREKYERKENV